MKKLLSMVLVLAMVLGLSVGAGAVSPPGLKAPEKLGGIKAAGFVRAAGAYDALTKEEWAELEEIGETVYYWTFDLWGGFFYGRVHAISEYPAAYKPGKTYEGLMAAGDLFEKKMYDSAERKAITSFEIDDVAVVQAYLDGTLAAKLTKLYVAYILLLEKEINKLCEEFFKPEALAFADQVVIKDLISQAFYIALFAIAPTDEEVEALFKEFEGEFIGLMAELEEKWKGTLGWFDEQDVWHDGLIDQWPKEGKWTQATAAYQEYNEDIITLYKLFFSKFGIEFKLPEKPSLSSSIPATYTVTYNLKGGTGSFPQQSFSETTAGAGAAVTLYNNAPTRSGYIFKGWDTSSAATTKVYDKGAKFTITANVTLYAVWEKEPGTGGPEPEPSLIARIWQAIVKWMFFGWLIALFR